MNTCNFYHLIEKLILGINTRRKTRACLKIAFICIMMALMLSGCSGIENQMIRYAGILDDEDYKKYVDLRDTGQLDQDGFYKDTKELVSEDGLDSTQDSIHVSFAANSCLDIEYYWDAELTEPIDTEACYLKPGECVYVKEPESRSPYGSFYCFDEFRIYACDSEQNKRERLFWNESSNELIVRVPADYTGSEITVEPVGRYEKRTLTLEDYYTDSSGNMQALDGRWFINGKETRDENVEISPVTSYMVDYKYDADKYEFVASEPNSFSYENGRVQFEAAGAETAVERYSVRLRPLGREFPLKIVLTDSVKDIFFSISTLENIKQEDIKYDNGEKTSIRPDWMGGTDRLVFDRQIRMGSDVTIEAESGTLRQENSLKLDIVSIDTDGREYRSIEYITGLPGKGVVPIYGDEAGADSTITYQEVRITISKVETVSYEPQTVPNATVEVSLADMDHSSILQKGDVLEPSGTVRVKIIPDEEYYVTGSDVDNGIYSNTMSYTKWSSDADEIFKSHPVKKIRSITLDSSDAYGTCVYKLDGEVVSGTIKIRDGQELTLEYTITDSDYQIVSGGLLSGLINSLRPKTSETRKISLSEIPDGDTIRRSDYIEVEKREN